MKKKWFVFLIGLFLAGSLAAQIPTILPTSQLTETLELLRGARIKAGQYLNFGPTYGTAGYGIYDNAGTLLQYKNSGGSWANLGAGGATTFLALTDTPAAYTAAGGYLVRVNAGATVLEFTLANGAAVGLGNVENTALSTWVGTANITTLGTIGTGAWNATAIADGKIASVLTGKSYNGVTPTAAATGFSLAGGTTSKTLTVELDSIINQDLSTDSTVAAFGKVNGLTLTANATGFSLAEGTISKSLTVELDSLVNQDLTTDAGVTFANVTDSALTATYIPKAGTAGLLGNSVVTQSAAGDVTVNETRGAELLSDGNFATEPTAAGWTLGANWTWSAVNYNVTKASGATNLSYAVTLTTSALYKLVFTTSTVSGGTIIPSLGGAAAGEGYAVSAAGTYTMYIIAAGNNLLFTAASATVVTMDDISLTLVSGGDLTCARNLLLGMSGQARFGDATYYHILQNSAKEGLAGTDFRIGLDESNRTLIICDRGDIRTDNGLSAATNPTVIIENAAANGNVKITSTGATGTGDFTITASGTVALVNSGSNQFKIGSTVSLSPAANIAAGNYFQADYTVFGDNKNLTDTDGEQSWIYFNAAPNQSSTAAFNLIKGNAVLTGLGSGATGNGNNLLNLSVSAVPKFLVNVDGSVTAGQVSVSLADNAVHDTGITAFYGQLTVKDTTTDVTGIFRLDGGATPVIISAHTNFSTTQGTDVKINVYFSTTYKIENCNTAASVVKCAFVGTI